MGQSNFDEYLHKVYKTVNGERSPQGLLRDFYDDCRKSYDKHDHLNSKYFFKGYPIYFISSGHLKTYLRYLESINGLKIERYTVDRESIYKKFAENGNNTGFIFYGTLSSSQDAFVGVVTEEFTEELDFYRHAHLWFFKNKCYDGVYKMRFIFDGVGYKCKSVDRVYRDIVQNEFPEMRYRHCYAVGRKMYDYAKSVLHKPEKECIALFTLGNLHDIGYEFNNSDTIQGEIVASALGAGYLYSREIEKHSMEPCGQISEELMILYWADATVKGDGTYCTYEERKSDLIKRHGINSPIVSQHIKIVEFLKSKGFRD